MDRDVVETGCPLRGTNPATSRGGASPWSARLARGRASDDQIGVGDLRGRRVHAENGRGVLRNLSGVANRPALTATRDAGIAWLKSRLQGIGRKRPGRTHAAAPLAAVSIVESRLAQHPASLKAPIVRALSASDRGHSRASANAIAGAAAGVLVSVCLHPIDTLKVLIQSQASSVRQIPVVLGKFLTQRGARGLYSGLAANLACSAPISAIYTSSYEVVKEALLPMIPASQSWVAHCVAGGCASIATSFVYTPSECIKQRMQVQAHKSTASAMRVILKQDGLSGFYRGWTAVLARNIPHSAIKFFSFEQLKWILLSKQLSAAQDRQGSSSASSSGEPLSVGLSPVQMLVIGGIAGSTAACFTTPFDVIKTRLQTQGALQSATQHKGVVDALFSIIAKEGVGGLYRGIAPRLLIYMSQGAIFFASYEIVKQLVNVHMSSAGLAQVIDTPCTPSDRRVVQAAVAP
mmetsp:Transcript_18870/g.36375  ORF Transcript_18870/g.36375 Transcript_18870/m.36375 type:complete len:463 (-) Transcript_18870:184-1572(-)|eukprot:CAMPEP_0114251614 /NCGR_PEP_ID=MMETSP0058-20121206/15368_1 /TAXON_ID=36894 /ORGANISM="Pyramimonas parkeae, CCMP726" /LENGTH=462 /DNA_ID=CAMNT_0001365435 /DNA_START=67 /DNA_END=1455 /DNA_ORIENTATION=-